MIRPRAHLLIGVATGALLAVPALAADDSAARAQLEQRLRLTATLMADGATQQRIQASGDARAQGHLDQGRVHHSLARDLLAKGDLDGARRAADEALKHFATARRMVPDAPARQAAARQRQEQLMASLERLVESWRARAGPQEAPDGDMVAAIGLMATARAQVGEARHEDAVHTLVMAEGHVLAGMKRLLDAKTLDYTARAGTPAEEYQQELARHASLAELVPLAIDDLKPRPEAVALIDRYTEASTKMRTLAENQFRAGDVQQALANLRTAVLNLQRALTTAGLVIPQPTGNPP